ncbi:MAG TPA: DUF4184 family protein [Blastocatellia bacterium]|nr:DUF4184 family protein [Blastocatellia bacterium]
MPFTPYHLGLGALAKGVASKHCSLSAFAASQVVIDCETLYYLLNNRPPIHRTLHTFVGGAAAGLLVALLLWAAGRILFRLAPPFQKWLSTRRDLGSELTGAGCLAGGLLGGLSHPVLDGIMHPDVRPFLPWSASTPLLRTIDLETLHTGLVVLGIIGGLLLVVRVYRGSD